jgi:putative flippase GtrA
VLKELINIYKSQVLVRFLFTGAINTLFGVTIGVVFLFFLPFHFTLSIFLATCVGVAFNYFMSLKFVFQTNGSRKAVFLFLLAYLATYIINITAISILINKFGLSDIISFVIISPFIVCLTYLLQKNIIFK